MTARQMITPTMMFGAGIEAKCVSRSVARGALLSGDPERFVDACGDDVAAYLRSFGNSEQTIASARALIVDCAWNALRPMLRQVAAGGHA